MTTPKLQMPELSVGQAGKELTHNQALAILDQLAQAVVVDKDLATPPGSPANGAMYIVATGATGEWAGQSGNLAFWLTSVGAWTFAVPVNGWSVWVTDEAVRYERKAGAWVVSAAGGSMANPMTTAGDMIYGGDAGAPTRLAPGSNTQVMTMVAGLPGWATPGAGGFTGGTLTSALNEAPPVTLASAATVNIGAAAANTINITGAVTITAFGTIAAGAKRTLIFGGTPVLTHNATSLILPGGVNIATAAGDVAAVESLGGGNWRCFDYMRADGTSALRFPLVSAYQASSQTIPNSTLFTKINLDTELVDSEGAFNTSTSRFQPTRAGYYLVLGGAVYQHAIGDAGSIIVLSVYKNGARVNNLSAAGLSSSPSSGMNGCSIVSMNGSTDYVELFTAQGAAGSLSLQAGSSTVFFQSIFMRAP